MWVSYLNSYILITQKLYQTFSPVFRPPMDLQRDIDTSTPLMYRRVGVTAMSEIEVRSPRVEHHIENRSAVHRDLDNTVMSEAETRPPTSFGGPTSSSSSSSDRTLTDRQSLTAQKRTPRAVTTHPSRVITAGQTPEPQSERRKRRIGGKDSARSQKSLKVSTTSSEEETKQRDDEMVEARIPFGFETLDMSDNRRVLPTR